MLTSFILILLVGFFSGQIARRVRLPALVGMVLAGILLGPQVTNLIVQPVLAGANDLRVIAVMVILMKAGLGLDREKLRQQGSVALRLGLFPALGETLVIAIAAIYLLQFNFLQGLLLGTILSAESPAVIVPGMLQLKSLGWGVKKGIPDAILMGSALSDILVLSIFSLVLGVLAQGPGTGVAGKIAPFNQLQFLPLQIMAQIGLGLLVGALIARLMVVLLGAQNWTQSTVQDTLVAAVTALGLIVLSQILPLFSGYLAVMTFGFFLLDWNAPLARRLRKGFDALWDIAQILLFVLLGANIPLTILGQSLGMGLLLLGIGTFVGRVLGWIFATWGSNWTAKERLFLLPGNSAKATVQAAIGAMPLAAGIEGGETMLAIAALSILVTAPLGAWAIPTFAPRLLQRGEVDPTKVAIRNPIKLLAAVDTSPMAAQVLKKTAELARRVDAEVLVLHIQRVEEPEAIAQLQAQAQALLADIRYQWQVVSGSVPETIVNIALAQNISDIVMGKHSHRPIDSILLGSVSQSVLETSPIPVIVVGQE